MQTGTACLQRLRRWLLLLLIVTTTAAGTWVLAAILQVQGLHPFEMGLLILFPILFAWIATAFWTAMAGLWVLVRGRDPCWLSASRKSPEGEREAESRIALAMPIFEEDPHQVLAGLRATYESLRQTGQAHRFDVYILSDSKDPETWIAEELAWNALCEAVDGYGQIFYHRRQNNWGRKSGNIAEFCQTWGLNYDYMVVLDADSVMAGDTLVEMAELMDANPGTALIQVPPAPVHQETLFARIQQFAGAAYGPLFAHGLSFWQLGEGNYWGHNAIIRVAPFVKHCGLPELPGKPPLGGEILSHDFVEAALLRRAGWQVWMAPWLGGSFEETPPSLVEHLKRDRRWCQGNLQHARLLLAQGFRLPNRVHLGMGVLTYLSSPLWLIFLVLSGMEALRRKHTDPVYFLDNSLFPVWPPTFFMEAATLLVITLGFLYLPKLFGYLLLFRDSRMRARFGGGPAAGLSMVLESLFSALLAPILMLFQTRFVVANLLGRAVGWTPQKRGPGAAANVGPLVTAVGWQTPIALVVGAWAYFNLSEFFLWLIPVLIGPLLVVPITLFSGLVSLGRAAARLGLFVIPAESAPPEVLRRLDELTRHPTPVPGTPGSGESYTRQAVMDPFVNALHVSLTGSRAKLLSQQYYLDSMLTRVQERGLEDLAPAEMRVLLGDGDTMLRLHAIAWETETGAGALSPAVQD
ncbi:glucans biosynthesis glucosyltransferase MdoH [Thiohalorhabdus methylotrophus]|uniref:Glucans biosynthesis glucosyltransferase H n=1 Tax=Thiohalorhabdus methylotrophus TaxID=3242694 RepID=A0ABV4TUW5_9GAMM